jgi:hypothetical protein
VEPLEAYQELLARLDGFFARALAQAGPRMRCGPGCADCCARDLGLFPVEVERLVRAARGLPAGVRAEILARAERAVADAEAPCPLLDAAGRCACYAHRPVICRTHGLPLLVPREGAPPELSLCPLNFQGAVSLSGEAVLDLGPVNAVLATVNHLWCAAEARAPGRLKVAEALRDALAPGRPAQRARRRASSRK